MVEPGSPEKQSEEAPVKLVDSIGAVLKRKSGGIWSLGPEATVYEAIEMMAAKGVGALLVLAEGKVTGVISERDYARKVILKGKSSKQTLVKEIMSSPVVSVGPKDTVDQGMTLMTEKRIRHLAVVEDDKLVGVVSIGDLVKWIISGQEEQIHHLEDYISGKYPG